MPSSRTSRIRLGGESGQASVRSEPRNPRGLWVWFDRHRVDRASVPRWRRRTTTPTDQTEPRSDAPYERDELTAASSLVLLNTGHGKGKSTAAFGTLLRAVALDWDSAVVQFLKSGKWHTGEEKVCRKLGVDWFAAGDGYTWESDDLDETQAKAVAAWRFAKDLIATGEHRPDRVG